MNKTTSLHNDRLNRYMKSLDEAARRLGDKSNIFSDKGKGVGDIVDFCDDPSSDDAKARRMTCEDSERLQKAIKCLYYRRRGKLVKALRLISRNGSDWEASVAAYQKLDHAPWESSARRYFRHRRQLLAFFKVK